VVNILMSYALTLEKNTGKPQPRRHRCEDCGIIFICSKCTKTMKRSHSTTNWALTCKSCANRVREGSGIYKKGAGIGYKCDECA
jgi:hypothetical protein